MDGQYANGNSFLYANGNSMNVATTPGGGARIVQSLYTKLLDVIRMPEYS